MRTLKEAEHLGLENKRVFLRVDFNVPIKDGKIQDDTKIKNSIPTIAYLKERKARVIICSHIASSDKSKVLSLKPIAIRLSELIKSTVKFSPTCITKKTNDIISKMVSGDILLLENIRTTPLEEKNSESFAKKMASMADLYVNDAFSVSHRRHASVVGIPKYLPSYAGLSLQETLQKLDRYIKNPVTPVMAIVGGEKISSKLGLLQSLVREVNTLCVTGAMANTFLLSKGIQVGLSICEPNLIETAKQVEKAARQNNCKLVLPRDVVLSDGRQVLTENIGKQDIIMDIGKTSVEEILENVKLSKTVWWNGPLGKFEVPPFDIGTKIVARGLAESAKTLNTIIVAGGGDTVHAIKKSGINFNDYAYVSTAGGAFLEFIKESTLPGIEILKPDIYQESLCAAFL